MNLDESKAKVKDLEKHYQQLYSELSTYSENAQSTRDQVQELKRTKAPLDKLSKAMTDSSAAQALLAQHTADLESAKADLELARAELVQAERLETLKTLANNGSKLTEEIESLLAEADKQFQEMVAPLLKSIAEKFTDLSETRADFFDVFGGKFAPTEEALNTLKSLDELGIDSTNIRTFHPFPLKTSAGLKVPYELATTPMDVGRLGNQKP